MRAIVPLACLCLSACRTAEPDPPPVDPAALAAQRRAENDAIIRARRAELARQREARQQERSGKTAEQRLQAVLEESRAASNRRKQEHYELCLEKRRENPSVCNNLRPSSGP